MALFLVQHGKNLPKDQDPDKGLSPEGNDTVRRIAQVAAGYGVAVKEIRHSGKKRARETAELLGDALKPSGGITSSDRLGPTDDPAAVASDIRLEDDLMLVGHLPFMEKMVSHLIHGDQDRPVIKFQNGGIVCLDFYPDTTDWVIKWALMPEIG